PVPAEVLRSGPCGQEQAAQGQCRHASCSHHHRFSLYFFRISTLPDMVWIATLAPPPLALNCSSFWLVQRLALAACSGASPFSIEPRNVETSTSAPWLPGTRSVTEPLTVSMERSAPLESAPLKVTSPETASRRTLSKVAPLTSNVPFTVEASRLPFAPLTVT